jgi:hypothetical protein
LTIIRRADDDRATKRPERQREMYESIKTLYNVEPPVADEEVRAAALEYIRKISGFYKPAPANEEAVSRAVDEITAASRELLGSLVTSAPPRRRDLEANHSYLDWVPVYGSGE